MKFHEYANIYRMLPDIELTKLAADIKEKGQLLPITSYENQILDGRNRYRACEIAGVKPKIETYTGDDPLGLIASLNDHRRHDTENERAMVGARMANLKNGQTACSMEQGDVPVVTLERAAELSGSSPANIRRAKPIVQTGIPELQDMVDRGEVSIRAGSEVAKLPEAEQRKAVMGGVDSVKKAAKKASANKPIKPKRKCPIPNEADIKKENQRILGNLKASWAIAPKHVREEFLAWVESTKNTTNA
jgi:hypothetical protein